MDLFKGNWIDLVIIIIFLYFFLDSFRHNFFIILIEFLSFFLSLLLGFRFYNLVSQVITSNFPIPVSISKTIGFFITVCVSEAILAALMLFVYKKIPNYIKNIKALNYLRFIVGLLDGFLLVSFLIPLTLSFPIPSFIKDSLLESKIGNIVYSKTLVFEKNFKDIFGGIISEGINLLTVSPKSSKSIALNITEVNLSTDYENEKSMFNLVNLERKKAGVNPLTLRQDAVEIARNYATDMWQRNYFSHYSPEGKSVSDRLAAAGILYSAAGENLALAPTLIVAHTGLMNSEDHKRNILDPIFKQIAIGVVDNGVYGKIFVQIFTD